MEGIQHRAPGGRALADRSNQHRTPARRKAKTSPVPGGAQSRKRPHPSTEDDLFSSPTTPCPRRPAVLAVNTGSAVRRRRGSRVRTSPQTRPRRRATAPAPRPAPQEFDTFIGQQPTKTQAPPSMPAGEGAETPKAAGAAEQGGAATPKGKAEGALFSPMQRMTSPLDGARRNQDEALSTGLKSLFSSFVGFFKQAVDSGDGSAVRAKKRRISQAPGRGRRMSMFVGRPPAGVADSPGFDFRDLARTYGFTPSSPEAAVEEEGKPEEDGSRRFEIEGPAVVTLNAAMDEGEAQVETAPMEAASVAAAAVSSDSAPPRLMVEAPSPPSQSAPAARPAAMDPLGAATLPLKASDNEEFFAQARRESMAGRRATLGAAGSRRMTLLAGRRDSLGSGWQSADVFFNSAAEGGNARQRRMSLLYNNTDRVIDEIVESPISAPAAAAPHPLSTVTEAKRASVPAAATAAPPATGAVPLPPAPPAPPPPPPMLSAGKGGANPAAKARVPKSVSALQSMQSRLRRRMTRSSSAAEQSSPAKKKLDPKIRQWLEIQGKQRGMKPEEFLLLARSMRLEVTQSISEVHKAQPTTVDEVQDLVARLDNVAQWFSGGTKEMKQTLPQWQLVEKKLEVMVECLQVTKDMKTRAAQRPAMGASFEEHTARLEKEFLLCNKKWATILAEEAAAWHKYNLPVDSGCLRQGTAYMKNLVVAYFDAIQRETESMRRAGLRASRCRSQRKLLFSGLRMLELCQQIQRAKSHFGDILRLGADALSSYITLANTEYGLQAATGEQSRGDVTELFEDKLRAMSVLKAMAVFMAKNETAAAQKATFKATQKRATVFLAECVARHPALQDDIYQACRILMQHIMAQAQPALAAGTGGGGSTKTIKWLMFGCKFTNKVLELLGPDRVAEDDEMRRILTSLQDLEVALPTDIDC